MTESKIPISTCRPQGATLREVRSLIFRQYRLHRYFLHNKKRRNDGIKRSSPSNRDLGTFRMRPANDLLKVNRARASRFLFPHVARRGAALRKVRSLIFRQYRLHRYFLHNKNKEDTFTVSF